MMRPTPVRRGGALIMAMAILAVLGVLFGTTAMHVARTRMLLVHRADVLQARWLGLAGIEIAADRLREGDFQSATLEPIASARVTVTATKDPKNADRFVVRAVVEYPTDAVTMVKTTIERTIVRTGDAIEIKPIVP